MDEKYLEDVEDLDDEEIDILENFLGGTFHQDMGDPDDALWELLREANVSWLEKLETCIREFLESELDDSQKEKFITDEVYIYFPAFNTTPLEWLKSVLETIKSYKRSLTVLELINNALRMDETLLLTENKAEKVLRECIDDRGKVIITDLTNVFKDAIRKEKYEKYRSNRKEIVEKIESNYDVYSDFDENSKWAHIRNKVDCDCRMMLLSEEYPVALCFIKEDISWLIELLSSYEVNIVYVDTEFMACAPEYLLFFRSNPSNLFIDDSFFYDNNIPFDYEAYEMIDDGCNYINPFRFDLSDLLNM